MKIATSYLKNLRSINGDSTKQKIPINKLFYIAVSAKCTTEPLSKLITSILTAVKEGLQSYHNTCYSCSGIISMWILQKIERSFGDPQFKIIIRM